MLIKKLMIRDTIDGFYDIYIFEREVEKKDVEEVIAMVKKQKEGEWTLDDMANAIQTIFPVKEVITFDDNHDVMDIC